MKSIHSKGTQIIILIVLIALVSISIAGTGLLSLPFFYEQTTQVRVMLFLGVSIFLSLLIFIATRVFILPFVKYYKIRSNLVFIILISVLLTVSVGLSYENLWAVPEIHEVEICFTAEDGSQSLNIDKIVDPNKNRLFPPDSFGFKRYPIIVESGSCITGRITNLVSRLTEALMGDQLTIEVQEAPPVGRFYVSINDVPAVVNFGLEDEEAQPSTTILYKDGFDQGRKIENPWQQYWFILLKSVAIVICAIYISLFLFGLTERIHAFQENIKFPVDGEKNNKKRRFSNKFPLYKSLLIFTIIYFVVFGVFMVHTDGQPDQVAHYYYSQKYSDTWGIPEDDANTFRVITGQPYLYYWINGAVYKIFYSIFPNSALRPIMLWRYLSVVYSLFTILFTYNLTKNVTHNPYAGVLSAFFLSNTMMFVFMSGGLSYDILMYLAAIAAINHLVNLYMNKDFIKNTALTGIWVIVGSLSKKQFLLLTLIIFLLWLFFVIRNLRKITFKLDKKNVVFSLIFLGFLILFLGLFGTNIIRYSKITPSCAQIMASDVCRTYSYRYEYYFPSSLQWMWFVRDNLTDPIKYALTYWIYKMLESIWGILSHYSFAPIFSVSLHGIMLIWAFFLHFYYWRPKDKISTLLFIILLGYCGYVFFWNYKTEVDFSFQHYGVTGRYLLPILGVLLTLMTNSFIKIKSKLLKQITIAFAVILYFAGGLGMYISRYATLFSHWRVYDWYIFQ